MYLSIIGLLDQSQISTNTSYIFICLFDIFCIWLYIILYKCITIKWHIVYSIHCIYLFTLSYLLNYLIYSLPYCPIQPDVYGWYPTHCQAYGLGLVLFLPNASSIYDLPDPPANQNPISRIWPGGKPGINKFQLRLNCMCETQKYKSYFILAIQNTGQMWLRKQMESCGTSSKKIGENKGQLYFPRFLGNYPSEPLCTPYGVDYPYL